MYTNFLQSHLTQSSEKSLQQKCTLCQKSIPNIFDCNLKINYQIMIIFGTNIPDTTCHQMTIQFPTSPNVCFCTT